VLVWSMEPLVQDRPPWTDCSKVHFWPDLDDMARAPSARLAAANCALATLPAADLHLWKDGSVAANSDDGAGLLSSFRTSYAFLKPIQWSRVWLNSEQKQKHSDLDCRQYSISKITHISGHSSCH